MEKDNDTLWLAETIDTASAWCAAHGVLMGSRRKEHNDGSGGDYYNVYEPAPFALEPSPFPKVAFEKCYDLGKPWNSIVHAVAQSYESWLRPTLLAAAESDPDFTGKLIALADDVIQRQQHAQRVALGIFRSDYLLQKRNDDSKDSMDSAYPLQVELNTIASSFGCLSTKVTQLHQFLYSDSTNRRQQLIDNPAATNIVDGLAAALQEYMRQRSSYPSVESQEKDYQPVVIMIVQPNEANSCDQRDLEFLLLQRHGIKLLRKSLLDVANYGKHSRAFQDKELIVPSMDEWFAAAVVYYRAGYTPNDYPSDREWEGRSIIEHSAAIKCPDVFYHLVGTKKVQQALAASNTLRQFCHSDEEYDLVASSFANLYSLGDEDDTDAVAKALEDPHSYVLKPQREGGGNNLYDDEMVKALQSMTRQQRSAYILMQRIQPPTFAATLVKGGKAILLTAESVCELGVFSVSLREYGSNSGQQGRIIMDTVGGHILRTKGAKTDEGGVAAGYAFLSSPLLV
jgi:glutathione synthetase